MPVPSKSGPSPRFAEAVPMEPEKLWRKGFVEQISWVQHVRSSSLLTFVGCLLQNKFEINTSEKLVDNKEKTSHELCGSVIFADFLKYLNQLWTNKLLRPVGPL